MDERPNELLRESAMIAHRLGLALSWTDGLHSKACTRGGSAKWKNAKRLPSELGAATGEFVTRARKRNPVVPVGANNLVIVEADLDVADDVYPPLDEVTGRVAAMMRRLGLRFPKTMIVRSRRGLHFYLRPPAGRPSGKVQLTEAGDIVTWTSDGYVVGVPGLHELDGVVYEYIRNGEIAVLP